MDGISVKDKNGEKDKKGDDPCKYFGYKISEHTIGLMTWYNNPGTWVEEVYKWVQQRCK